MGSLAVPGPCQTGLYARYYYRVHFGKNCLLLLLKMIRDRTFFPLCRRVPWRTHRVGPIFSTIFNLFIPQRRVPKNLFKGSHWCRVLFIYLVSSFQISTTPKTFGLIVWVWLGLVLVGCGGCIGFFLSYFSFWICFFFIIAMVEIIIFWKIENKYYITNCQTSRNS